jgi:hypothetical protein
MRAMIVGWIRSAVGISSCDLTFRLGIGAIALPCLISGSDIVWRSSAHVMVRRPNWNIPSAILAAIVAVGSRGSGNLILCRGSGRLRNLRGNQLTTVALDHVLASH